MAERKFSHSPDCCPSNHWNGGDDICTDCGTDLNAGPVDADIDAIRHNVARYDTELNRLEIAPNGDDYNAIMEMINGAAYRAPLTEGR